MDQFYPINNSGVYTHLLPSIGGGLMAWIESHQELGAHPKTLKFARLLNISRAAAVGHLHFLWWWALDYSQDGDLSRFEALDIAIGGEWEGDAAAFVDALARAGFIDVTPNGWAVHDWDQYGGRLQDRRAKDAERKRNSRSVQRTSSGHPADGAETPRDGVRNTTQHNRTQHNMGEESPKPPQRARVKEPTGFELFYGGYPKKVGRDDAEKAWKKLNPSQDLQDEINAAVSRQKCWESWQSGFIPNPATFLNGGRWKDEEPPKRGGSNGRASPFAGIDEFERIVNGTQEPAQGREQVFETTGRVQ